MEKNPRLLMAMAIRIRTSAMALKTSMRLCLAASSGIFFEVIRAIVDTGGYVGVYCIAAFIGRTRDIAAMMDHIEYLVKKFGADHVAIGTDLAYIPLATTEEHKKMGPRPKMRTPYESLWPAGQGPGRGHASLAWINWPMFTVGMVQRGISDDDIRKILGGNVMRVCRAVWDGRARS